MRWAALALVLNLQSQESDRVRALIEQLGSDEIAVREEAVKELTRIGYEAVPALKKGAKDSVGEKRVLLERLVYSLTAFGRPAWVSIEAKDKLLREIAVDVERQTGIPIRLIGAAADAKATVSAKNTIVWKIVEDICRARGDLMYRFQNDGIEIYPSKFRALPSVD